MRCEICNQEEPHSLRTYKIPSSTKIKILLGDGSISSIGLNSVNISLCEDCILKMSRILQKNFPELEQDEVLFDLRSIYSDENKS